MLQSRGCATKLNLVYFADFLVFITCQLKNSSSLNLLLHDFINFMLIFCVYLRAFSLKLVNTKFYTVQEVQYLEFPTGADKKALNILY